MKLHLKAWVGGVCAVLGLWDASVLAQTVLVDFGNNSSFRGVAVAAPDEYGRYWNSVFSGAFYANMVDTANQATTMDLGFDAAPATDSFNGPAGATSQPPTPSELAATVFDAAALGYLGVTNAVFDYYVNSTFQLQGLDTNRTYALTFFGAHKFSTDDATTYSLCSDNTYGTVLRSTNLNIQVPGQPWRHNSNTVASLSSVVPQPGGVLYVKFVGANGNSGYLNALRVDVEKSTPTLGVKASQEMVVGGSSITLTGVVAAAGGLVPTNGEIVRVSINGVTQSVAVAGGAGGFSLSYPVSSLGTGTYAITYTYAGNASSLFGATNAATTLSVTPEYQAVLIDLGNSSSFRGVSVASPDENGRYWNSVWSAAFFADMVNTSNQATRMDLGFDAAAGSDSFNGPAGATTQPPTPAELAATVFNASALGELGVTNAVFDYYINSRFQLQSLETGLVYRLTFFGSHKFSTDDATLYALCTDNTYATTTAVVSLNIQTPGSPNLHNTNAVAVLENVVPQADGKFYVAFQGANGNSGYLNSMRVQWVKAQASVTGVAASQSIPYGTTSVTLTGTVGAAQVPAQAGETVSVTINGSSQNATVGAGGVFSVSYPTATLPAGAHVVTYAYAGSTVLKGATNQTTSLTVTKLTPVLDVRASQSVPVGTASVTLTGLLSAAGGVVPANGEIVRVTINGVTQNASISGGAGAFSLSYPIVSLNTGSYVITHAYWGNAGSLFGVTNATTTLTVTPVYQTVLVDFGNNSSFRGTNVANPDVNGRTWNSVHSGAFYADLADQSNVATRVDLGFDAAPGTDSFNGPGGVFDAASLGELGVTNAVDDYYINSRFQLQSLETGLTYRLTFFGSHKFSTDDATLYALCTDNTYATTTAVVSLNIQTPGSPNLHNTNTVAVLENVVPQADGKFYVAFQGANGNSGYLNAMKVQWVKGTSGVSGVTASQSVPYGTASVTLTGTVGGLNVPAQAGEVVGVTINGVRSNATVSAGGAFSVAYPVSALAAGTYTITYAYAGSTVLSGSTNATTSLTVTKVTTTLGVTASQGVAVGTPSITLTGVVFAAGGVVPANGSTVRVTIDGVTQTTTIAGGAGAFSLSYPVSGLAGGVYTITYAYWGNASSLNGATNSDTQLTVTQATKMLIDFGRHDGVNGNATASPDGNGNYWNNLSSRAGDNVVTNGTRASNLITISGVSTPVAIEVISSGWLANGRLNGGLFSPNGPSFALLGSLAVETATEDYFYVDGAGLTKSLRLSGLNPSSTYNLRFFGTRDTASTRQTTYTVNGNAVVLTTSGSGIGNNGIYNGNDDEVVALNNLTPNGSGELDVAVTVTAGGFAYLGVLEVTDNGGFCSINTPVTMPRPANQTVYATGSANLSFTVTATDSGGCVAPTLQAYGLPSGATVTSSVSGSSRSGFFSWTPSPAQVGTYPVRFEATDVNEGGTTSFVMLVYVGQSGEGNSGGVPLSQTNWSVAIQEIPPSGANGDLTWTATPGIVYDVYYSDSDPAGSMTWQLQGQVTADASAEILAVPEGVKRYYKVVPAGGTPNKIGLWGVIKPTIAGNSYTMLSAPLDIADRSMSGELGDALKAVLSNGDKVFALTAGGGWTTITLSGGNWDTAYTFAEGEGFFVERNGAAVTPRFTGPVGNDGGANRTINGAVAGRWNILGPSQGKTLAFASAFANGSFSGTPTANWNQNVADVIAIDQGGGVFKRYFRSGDGAWRDASNLSTSITDPITPGKAVYYFHYGNGSLSINF